MIKWILSVQPAEQDELFFPKIVATVFAHFIRTGLACFDLRNS
jgi:hypothetical protein